MIVDPDAWAYFLENCTQECDDGVAAENMTPVTTEDRGKIQFSTEEMKVLYEALSFTDQLQTKDYERASEGVDLEALFQKVMKLANLN